MVTLNEKIDYHKKQLKILESIVSNFKSVKIIMNRWNVEYYSSPEINSIATEFALAHSCGCCSDSPLYIMPCIFHMVDNEKIEIFVDPFQICIGEQNSCCCENGEECCYCGTNDRIYSNWKEELKKYNINNELIEKIDKHLTKENGYFREDKE